MLTLAPSASALEKKSESAPRIGEVSIRISHSQKDTGSCYSHRISNVSSKT